MNSGNNVSETSDSKSIHCIDDMSEHGEEKSDDGWESGMIKKLWRKYRNNKYQCAFDAASKIGLMSGKYSKWHLISTAVSMDTTNAEQITDELLRRRENKKRFMQKRQELIAKRASAMNVLKKRKGLAVYYRVLMEYGFDTLDTWIFLMDEHALLMRIFENQESLIKSFQSLVMDYVILQSN